MAYTTISFGGITFDTSRITAVKAPGTLKQIMGKRVVHRRLPQRDIWDWDITLNGIFEGTPDEIDAFKESLYNLFGDKQAYIDGVTVHAGDYIIDTNGLTWDESPERYDNGHMLFSLRIIQFQQT